MKRGLLIAISALLIVALTGCGADRDVLDNGEYKPAIRVDDQIYWLTPTGNVDVIADDCEVIGQIERISSPSKPPERNWEAIGFADSFLGADIYRSEGGDTLYVYNPEIEQYIPFELITE
ncbi:MAG: hypothetical protein R6U70_04320 [Bacillota bacterium]